MSNLKVEASKGVFWSVIERFSVQGVQFIIGIVMARILSPSDYGLIGMLAIFMSLSQVFIDGGFSTALIQKQDRTSVDYSTVFYINMGISIFFYLLLFIAAPFIAYFYEQPLLVAITRVYALNLIINSFAAVQKTILVINVDFKTQSKISLASAIISGLIGVYFAYNGLAVWALVVQSIVCAILNVLLCVVYVKWKPAFIFSIESFKSLFGFGSKVLIASIISNVYTNLYSLAIGKKFTAADLGYYTRANQFASLAGDNITSILARVSLPVLSKIQDDDIHLILAYRKYLKSAVFVVFPLIMVVCGLAKPIVLLLLTEKWHRSILLLQILSINYIFSPITSINLNLLYVKGRSDLILKLEIIKKTIAFLILGISLFFSLEWVCAGLSLYAFISIFLNTHYTKKLLDYGIGKQFVDVASIFFISILVLVTNLIISQFINEPYLAIIIGVLLSGAIYLGVSYIIRLPELYEFANLIMPLIKKNRK